jgi:1,2-diacylglycerol 3-beta-glucosyltransferase
VLAGALELFLVSLGLTYYVATVGAGLRVIRRARKARRALAAESAASAAGGTGSRRRPGSRRSGRRDASTSSPGSSGPGFTGPRSGRPGSRRPASRRRAAPRAGRNLDPAAADAAPPAAGSGSDLAASMSAGWGRLRTKLETAEEPAARAGVVIPAADCVVYYLIPCLNEELVIGDTVRSLLTDARGLVVVVDDASDDRTGELAAAAGGDRVMVVRRELPEARRGKGPALNAGFAQVLHDAGVRGIPSARITVCVMDADGRLSDGALEVVLPLFEDPRVGGVQLPVRIRNRNSVLTVMQDLEFWGVCAVAQLGRMACGTVSLGGNGQFTRLAALLEMGRTPWQAQLTEDLDLSLALAAKGWRLTSAPDAHVSQQGVTSLRALINQRTRWYQGHMQAVRWLRELWSSRQLSHLAMLELTIYLLVPWALVLPWSIIFNYNLLIMVLWTLGWVATPGLGNDLTQKIATLVFWYTLSCLPIYMAGFLYGRQERKVGYIRAFFIGHLLLVGNYVTYVACWRAVYRLITGAHGWEKTRRTDERRVGGRPAQERPAGAPAPLAPLPAFAGPGLAASGLAGSELAASALGVPGLAASGLAVSGLAAPGVAASEQVASELAASAAVAPGLPGPEWSVAVPAPVVRPALAPAQGAVAPAAANDPAVAAAAVRVTAELDVRSLDVSALDPAAWAAAARPATWTPASPLRPPAARWSGPIRSGSVVADDSPARVPAPRRPAPAELRPAARHDRLDRDATTAGLPVVAQPAPAARHARAGNPRTGDAARLGAVPEAVSAGAGRWGARARARAAAEGVWAGDISSGGTWAVDASAESALGSAADAGDEGLRHLSSGRAPDSRSEPGPSRRAAGSHRAARARPAQRSGR